MKDSCIKKLIDLIKARIRLYKESFGLSLPNYLINYVIQELSK